jgi:hypothetical protein
MQMSDLISRVRLEVGDPSQPFKTSTLGDGFTNIYDLPKQNLDINSFTITIINGVNITNLNSGIDFTANVELGVVELTNPVPNGATLVMQGNAWGMFTDDDMTTLLTDAVSQHTFNRVIEERLRTNPGGFISYRNMPLTLTNLPDIEEPLIVMLGTLTVLWTLANDAATDANIQTAEGTNVDRVSRYRQLMDHIAYLQERYERYCGQLNVGVFRIETMRLRRVSRTTGRLVPIFTDREYDDHTWPQRELPSIDSHNQDDSGIPSPLWNAQGM